MINFKNLPPPYRKLSLRSLGGLAIALAAAIAGVLLVGISGWFITATAVTGLGLMSMQQYNLFLPSAIIRFLALAKPPLKYAERLYNHKLTFRLAGQTRTWLFRQLFNCDKESLVKFRDIELTTKMTNDVNQLDQLLTGLLLPWVINFVICLTAIIYFFRVQPLLAMFISGIYLICGIILPLISLKAGLRSGGDYSLQQLESHLSDHLSGHKELQSSGIFTRYSQDARSLIIAAGLKKEQELTGKALCVFIHTLVLESALVVVLILFCYIKPMTAGPSMVLSALLVIALFESISPLAGLFYEQADTFRSAQALNNLVKSKVGGQPADYLNPDGSGIFLSHIKFGYKKRLLFNDLCLTLPAATTTIIKGVNGSGKSTLMDLIFGFITPQSGCVFINGNKVTQNQGLKEEISYLEQDPAMFNVSIMENIMLAKPGASYEEANHAAVSAGLKDHLAAFQAGLLHIVEEEGGNLSGGQKRMIGLARVILKDAPIVMLDEPAEGMDRNAERNLIELVNSWHKLKTVILITHQALPGLTADRIYELTGPDVKIPR
ncbi:amino acid ABC transporter ATP-binding/permease protein [Mucilaginibacter angelicae]|uniref:Amino acid ABC transporter ATP-binding/permease protein n=1 Tax=Mucilaginibacter angelicae TaxID=869718 RepID=A0ABV6L050_9SPHI